MSEKPKRPVDDPEVMAMVWVALALRDLKPEGVERVLSWARKRYDEEPRATYLNIEIMQELVLARRKLGLPQGEAVTTKTLGIREDL